MCGQFYLPQLTEKLYHYVMPEDLHPEESRQEKDLGKENLHKKIKQEKETADLRAKIDFFQGHLTQGELYLTLIARSGGMPNIFLGDYGNIPSFNNDYLLSKIFLAMGVKSTDGSPMSTETLRNLAAQSQESNPQLKLQGEDGKQIDVDFFGGKNAVNFSCWLRGVSKNTKDAVISTLETIPPKSWAALMVSELAEHQGEIMESQGIFTLPLPDWNSPDLFSDLTYFLNAYSFGPMFGWTRQETEDLLNGGDLPSEKGMVGKWVNPENGETWILLPTRAMKGIALAVKKQESGLEVRLLADTTELRGRNLPNRFLESRTAKELLGVFEKLGLEPAGEMLNDFSEGSLGYGHYESRYGNGYADLSRLVTYILREGLGIDRLFALPNPDFTAEDLLGDSKKLSGPSQTILKIIAGIMGRDSQGGSPLIPNSGRSIRDGSCKDSEVYFSGAMESGRSFLRDSFICKSGYGADTKMNIVPIVAGGVEFPPGYLFRVTEQGGLEPLRATMYCFTSQEARDAFGWQYEECLNNDPFLAQAIDNFPQQWSNKP